MNDEIEDAFLPFLLAQDAETKSDADLMEMVVSAQQVAQRCRESADKLDLVIEAYVKEAISRGLIEIK